MQNTMSLIKIKNNGPKIEPSGTPADDTGKGSES